MSTLLHSTRNAIFTALFNLLLQTTPPAGKQWKTFNQALRQWDQVDSTDQPALFLHRGPQTTSQKASYGVAKWQLRATVWMYFRVDGLNTSSTYPDQLTDQLIDSLEQVMQPTPPDMQQTLGGLVEHAWIDGTIVWDTFTDGQAILVAPISIYI